MNMDGKKRAKTIDTIQVEIKNRLRKAISELEINISVFAKKIGVSQSSLSKYLGMDRGLNLDIITAIYANYPSLNIDWLITGRGPMLFSNPDYGIAAEPELQYVTASEVDELKTQLIETQRLLIKCQSSK